MRPHSSRKKDQSFRIDHNRIATARHNAQRTPVSFNESVSRVIADLNERVIQLCRDYHCIREEFTTIKQHIIPPTKQQACSDIEVDDASSESLASECATAMSDCPQHVYPVRSISNNNRDFDINDSSIDIYSRIETLSQSIDKLTVDMLSLSKTISDHVNDLSDNKVIYDTKLQDMKKLFVYEFNKLTLDVNKLMDTSNESANTSTKKLTTIEQNVTTLCSQCNTLNAFKDEYATRLMTVEEECAYMPTYQKKVNKLTHTVDDLKKSLTATIESMKSTIKAIIQNNADITIDVPIASTGTVINDNYTLVSTLSLTAKDGGKNELIGDTVKSIVNNIVYKDALDKRITELSTLFDNRILSANVLLKDSVNQKVKQMEQLVENTSFALHDKVANITKDIGIDNVKKSVKDMREKLNSYKLEMNESNVKLTDRIISESGNAKIEIDKLKDKVRDVRTLCENETKKMKQSVDNINSRMEKQALVDKGQNDNVNDLMLKMVSVLNDVKTLKVNVETNTNSVKDINGTINEWEKSTSRFAERVDNVENKLNEFDKEKAEIIKSTVTKKAFDEHMKKMNKLLNDEAMKRETLDSYARSQLNANMSKMKELILDEKNKRDELKKEIGKEMATVTTSLSNSYETLLTNEREKREEMCKSIMESVESLTKSMNKTMVNNVAKVVTTSLTKMVTDKVSDEREQREMSMKEMESKITAMNTTIDTAVSEEREQRESSLKEVESKINVVKEMLTGDVTKMVTKMVDMAVNDEKSLREQMEHSLVEGIESRIESLKGSLTTLSSLVDTNANNEKEQRALMMKSLKSEMVKKIDEKATNVSKTVSESLTKSLTESFEANIDAKMKDTKSLLSKLESKIDGEMKMVAKNVTESLTESITTSLTKDFDAKMNGMKETNDASSKDLEISMMKVVEEVTASMKGSLSTMIETAVSNEKELREASVSQLSKTMEGNIEVMKGLIETAVSNEKEAREASVSQLSKTVEGNVEEVKRSLTTLIESSINNEKELRETMMSQLSATVENDIETIREQVSTNASNERQQREISLSQLSQTMENNIELIKSLITTSANTEKELREASLSQLSKAMESNIESKLSSLSSSLTESFETKLNNEKESFDQKLSELSNALVDEFNSTLTTVTEQLRTEIENELKNKVAIDQFENEKNELTNKTETKIRRCMTLDQFQLEQKNIIDERDNAIRSYLAVDKLDPTIGNPKNSHRCIGYHAVNDSFAKFKIGVPVYFTAEGYVYDSEQEKYVSVNDLSSDYADKSLETIKIYPGLTLNGTWKEFAGVCTNVNEKTGAIGYANSGTYLVHIASGTHALGVGETIYIDTDGVPAILADNATITSKMNRMIMGTVTAIVNEHYVQVRK